MSKTENSKSPTQQETILDTKCPLCDRIIKDHTKKQLTRCQGVATIYSIGYENLLSQSKQNKEND